LEATAIKYNRRIIDSVDEFIEKYGIEKKY